MKGILRTVGLLLLFVVRDPNLEYVKMSDSGRIGEIPPFVSFPLFVVTGHRCVTLKV